MLRSPLNGRSSAAVQRRNACAAAGCSHPVIAPRTAASSSRNGCAARASSDEPSTSSSGSMPAAAAAALAALLLGSAAPAWAALQPQVDVAELAAVAVEDDDFMDQYDRDMEQLAESVDPEVAMPPELQEFLRLFERGTPRDLRKLEAAREKVGFRRGADGRVSLISDGGEEFAIDLSDDVLVAQLFANGLWEEVLEPLEVVRAPEDGTANASASAASQLRLSEEEFRGVVSLLQGAQEMAEEPLEDLPQEDDGQQQQ
ncbi:hypothetical protein MNEG_13375 [Monoraphidium neglectum]|uniref:Uncharacterized protein n=1 Tax=Monoraphidium neglectum TaxID=145388 RepID=A0A0D2LYU5_9CHLO|nr:hypothetical protein MNEG_13375 [Monoraphidium neglectum]KIY94586.1 hypothetical protein MNEG_13375 [Monoraphidium neglectum]|eukprot:XP_013893606.1 hypothetical protein MNEG_13375 [Monoraphidium neglectum]